MFLTKESVALTLLWLGDLMDVRWLGWGKITHSPEKLLWSMWSKILWYNRKTTLVGAIDRKKSHVASLWRQYDVITQK